MTTTPDSSARMPPAALWLVVNPASGSNSDESVADVRRALSAAGMDPRRTICFPDEALPTRAELDAAGIGILAVFTGDGTINAQAALLHDWGGALLILPGGTQNLLARALHGDAEPDAIIAAVGRGEASRCRLQAVRTSRGHALVEAVAGPAVAWAGVREGLRTLDVPAIAGALGEAVRATAAGALVHVAEPALGRPEGYRAVRMDARPDGLLAVDGYDATDWRELAEHASNMIVHRDFRNGPHEDLGRAARIVCRSSAPIALMLDGEQCEGAEEEVFTAEAFPVDFLRTGPATRD